MFPEKAKLKVRKEHYVLCELERIVPELSAFQSIWDCPVPGGCSLKRPDKLYVMADRYLQIEVDEWSHADYACLDEDARLEIIAADVGLPGLVLRLDPDEPQCFRRKRLNNGETVETKTERFDVLLRKAAQRVHSFLQGDAPTEVVREWLDGA